MLRASEPCKARTLQGTHLTRSPTAATRGASASSIDQGRARTGIRNNTGISLVHALFPSLFLEVDTYPHSLMVNLKDSDLNLRTGTYIMLRAAGGLRVGGHPSPSPARRELSYELS